MSTLKCIVVLIFVPLLPQLAQAQEPISPAGKLANINGAKIYYEEYGKGEPLILLHGFARTASDWQPFIPELSKSYRVIAWDMRGHGRSTSPDTSVVFSHKLAAKDLLTLMEQLKIEKAKLIGHSSGGIISLLAAIMQPDKFEAIVPISAQTYFSTQVRDFITREAKPEAFFQFNDGEKLHGKIKGMHVARQFYHFRILQGDPAVTPDQLEMITARTLIIHGDNDFVPVANAWEMFQHIPNAHIFIVPNGWHLPQLGSLNGADLMRRTVEFLKGEWSKGFTPK